MQKVQQRSAYAEQRSAFLLTAFLLVAAISILFALFTKRASCVPLRKGQFLVAPCIGAFFGCCNLINVTLAARLESAVLFPTLNIGAILLSLVGGAFIFKEKLGRREITVLLIGTISILLLSLG